MLFQIQLALMPYKFVLVFLETVEKVDGFREPDFGQTFHPLRARNHFDMSFAGSAAAVAHAVQYSEVIESVLFGIVLEGVMIRPGVAFGIVGFVGRHVHDDFGIVYSLPYKSAVRKFVMLVPAQLYRFEIVHAAFFENLRQVTRKTEHVGKPAHAHFLAEFFLPEPLAV